MDANKDTFLYKELSYSIIGLGINVHQELGPGFLEKVYENAMVVLLKKKGIPFRQQYLYQFTFKEK